ncbi:MAG TPA: HD domain-containing protein, partial [Candidatus Tenderia electrophaga]|nr:HD domain-containing protein [Candidatus Tenderia electrophaga]
YAALTGTTINIPNIRSNSEFDFSGTLRYDQQSGYCSQSFLTVPMRDHEDEIIGVLQLINPTDKQSNNILAFSDEDQQLVESLASQAAVAITNQRLIGELKHLMEKFIEVIATAIDDKSPYTGYHCRRVPEIAMLLADAINANKAGPLADFKLDDKQRYELKIAALLHDCGKITTPVHVVDKATKLETIFDRIELIESRYEILRRDIEIAHLKQQLKDSNHSNDALQQQLQQLDDEFEFLKKANKGTEFMPETAAQRVKEISRRTWQNSQGESRPLLNNEEIDNLTIAKGTLLNTERQIINHHITMTINMLEALPFPKHLSNVPEIAGNHHERMDGKGYPRGLTREEMSVQARLMGIADIFDALTASDRPYKKPMSLSQALKILASMAEEGHVDPDLLEIFVQQKVYLRYAEKNLHPDQIDLH